MIGVRGDEKATALREFREAKASAARRACEKLPSGSLFVGEILQPFFGTIIAYATFKIENFKLKILKVRNLFPYRTSALQPSALASAIIAYATFKIEKFKVKI